jgi:hypothetical protein
LLTNAASQTAEGYSHLTKHKLKKMKDKLLVVFTLMLGFCVFLIIACTKNNNPLNDNTEKVLYQNTVNATVSDSKAFVLGGNTKQVTQISFNNSLLNNLKKSEIWKTTLEQLSLNTNDIKRTYFHTSKLTLITIPIIDNSIESVLNIFINDDNFLITKITTLKQANSNSLYKVTNVKNELYYQFELDTNNRIGKWVFDKEIPFKETFNPSINSKEAPIGDAPCASQPFNACMNCFIVKVCGNDWVCVAACGLFLPSCIGGAAAACVLL